MLSCKIRVIPNLAFVVLLSTLQTHFQVGVKGSKTLILCCSLLNRIVRALDVLTRALACNSSAEGSFCSPDPALGFLLRSLVLFFLALRDDLDVAVTDLDLDVAETGFDLDVVVTLAVSWAVPEAAETAFPHSLDPPGLVEVEAVGGALAGEVEL